MAEVFVPLNSFKSVITDLTGEDDIVYSTPLGVSSIVLSAQITNTGGETKELTIEIDSNREIPSPQTAFILNTGSLYSASALIELNREFVKKEAAAYIQFQNNLADIRFAFTSSIYESRVDTALSAITYDITNGGAIRTNKAALSYYDKNGVRAITDSLQVTASYNAINYANEMLQQILLNQSVTESVNISRLYQSIYTQSYNESLVAEYSASIIVDGFMDAIAQTIYEPVLIDKPSVELVKNFAIPGNDSFTPVIAGKLVLEEGYALIFSGSSDLSVILSILESANE